MTGDEITHRLQGARTRQGREGLLERRDAVGPASNGAKPGWVLSDSALPTNSPIRQAGMTARSAFPEAKANATPR